jgi:tetratricopeptide (TPR) repeat protein
MNDLDLIAVSMNNMGIVAKHLGKYYTALDNFHIGLLIALIMGNERKIATGLHNVGIIHDVLGEIHYDNEEYDFAFKEFDEALNLYEQCWTIEDKLKYEMGKSQVKNDIGMVYLHQDKHDEAISYFKESLAIKQKIGHYEGIYNNLYNIGLSYIDKDNYNQALPYLEDALDMAISIGNQKEIDKVNYELDKIKRDGEFRAG